MIICALVQMNTTETSKIDPLGQLKYLLRL